MAKDIAKVTGEICKSQMEIYNANIEEKFKGLPTVDDMTQIRQMLVIVSQSQGNTSVTGSAVHGYNNNLQAGPSQQSEGPSGY